MLRSIMGPMAIAVIGLSAAIGSAHAQDGDSPEQLLMEEGLDAVEPDPTIDEPAQVREPVYGPQVRGFTVVRPASCGEFKYWDGSQCADARDKKPPQP